MESRTERCLSVSTVGDELIFGRARIHSVLSPFPRNPFSTGSKPSSELALSWKRALPLFASTQGHVKADERTLVRTNLPWMSAPAIIARRALLSPVDGYSHCACGESNGRCDRSPFLNREQLRSPLPWWPSFGSERCPRWPPLEARLHFLQSGKRRIANLLRLWEDSYRIPIGGRHGAKTYGSSTGNS